MANNHKRQEQELYEQEQEMSCPFLDKGSVIIKLSALVAESGAIADYIQDTVQYGRALGYADGRQAAYLDLASRIIDGEFDPICEEDYEDGYEM
jgi:hypothetical protein